MEKTNSMTKRKVPVLTIVLAGIIASLYSVLTVMAASLNLASGAIQVRFSEVLTILPFFGFAGVPGVTIGCFISNIIIGSNLLDILFGTFATLIGALGTYYIGILFKNTEKNILKYLSPLPPIIANMVIVPFILAYAYHVTDSIPFLMLTVGAGEVISCGILGLLLLTALFPIRHNIFRV